MAELLYENPNPVSEYIDRQQGYSADDYKEKLKESCTLYIGNLSTFTKEEQIYELFSLSGKVKKVIMGLDRFKKVPCGFCFVEYYSHSDAARAVSFLNSTLLENRIIRADWDVGFKEGRQFGRGRGGGQKRDSVRNEAEQNREDENDTENLGKRSKRPNL